MRWLKDPIVLFLVLGAGLAALHVYAREEVPELPRETEIVVTDADVLWLRQSFEKTWQRPATAAEIRTLVEKRVRDEILYREAEALGLDRGDDALRRRLVMKLEFLAKDAGAGNPSEADLEAHRTASADRFARPGVRSFRQIFLSAKKRGEDTQADGERLRERLRTESDLDPRALGDATMIEFEQPRLSPRAAASTFGTEFAEALFEQETGAWVGPIASSYGLHVIRIDESIPGALPPLAEIRDRVRGDLIEERGKAALDGYVDEVRKKYTVLMNAKLPEEGGE